MDVTDVQTLGFFYGPFCLFVLEILWQQLLLKHCPNKLVRSLNLSTQFDPFSQAIIDKGICIYSIQVRLRHLNHQYLFCGLRAILDGSCLKLIYSSSSSSSIGASYGGLPQSSSVK